MSSSYAGRWDVLACGDGQGDVFWCNCLKFIELGAISLQTFCVLPGRRRKNIAYPWIGSVFLVPLAIPAMVALSQ